MSVDVNRRYFELRRQVDGLVYSFDLTQRADGVLGYKRRDADLWIVLDAEFGWVAESAITGDVIAGMSWGVLPHFQSNFPPEGDWVSKKGNKSFVYKLVYPE